jgi:hypothetical protein
MNKTVKKSKNTFNLTSFSIVSMCGAADFCIFVIHQFKKFPPSLIKWSLLVGKSSIVNRYWRDTFNPNYLFTVGIDFHSKIVHTNDGRIVRISIRLNNS